MLLAGVVILDPQVVTKIVDKPRLIIARIVFGIMHRDDDLELGRARFANALDRAHLVGLRGAGGVGEGAVLEAGGLDYQRVALIMADGIAVEGWVGDEMALVGHRLVQPDHADLMTELVEDRDLAGWPL